MENSCFGPLGSYKGSNGKVGVIGGCFEYTGAPYYAAVSALRSGCDLAHIFCTKSAGIPIKSYSPEIIVHPTLTASNEESISDYAAYSDRILELTTNWYPSLHCLIIGPGLGRDDFLINYLVPKLVSAAVLQMLDADGINMILTHKNLVQGYKQAVLTPNIIEFKRLWQAYMGSEPPEINVEESSTSWREQSDLTVQPALFLARQLGVHLFIKGKVDVISDGTRTLCVGVPGSMKRCGGQGDILTGIISTTLFNAGKNNGDVMQALATAAVLMRRSGAIAFAKKQRGLTAPDIIKVLPKALIDILGNVNL